MKCEIKRYPNLQKLSVAAAEFVLEVANRGVDERGVFTIALSGGDTPRTLYEVLALPPFASTMPWGRTHLFWGDERCVPPDDPASNFFVAHRALISKVALPLQHVHRMPAELEPCEKAAESYETVLRDFFSEAGRGADSVPCSAEGELYPSFDLVLLGVGKDGHTASLFPGDPALDEEERWAVGVGAGSGSPAVPRVTLTFPAINRARCALFLVSGVGKRGVVRAVLEDREGAGRLYPAARVNPRERMVWFLDSEFLC